jgi:UPF0042 nucleotide-binding protein
MNFIIITGMSGSGKSSCLHLLEDLGYYYIDNLPISLLSQLPTHLINKEKIAIGIDVRNLPENPEILRNAIQSLRQLHIEPQIIYLDTDEKTLIERFSATRRKHPLSNDGTSLTEALQNELERLDPLIQLANYRIDTSRLSIHQLQEQLAKIVQSTHHDITLLFQSFGFKYGLPRDSDYVFDVRCLINPYWNPELRDLSGDDETIMNFFADDEQVQQMISDITRFIETWLPAFRAEHRTYMTISIGCTGGRHRSVYIANCLYSHFKHLGPKGPKLQLRHRDLS